MSHPAEVTFDLRENHRPSRARWTICGLLALAAIINYVDRGALAVLATSSDFRRGTGLDEIGYGYAWASFMACYAVGQLLTGRLADRVGARTGYLVITAFWSLAEIAHAAAQGPLGFVAARALLGFAEAGCFPLAIKCIAERFPQHERALATGVFNAGASLGAIVGPLLVPLLCLHFGWRWTFVLTGLMGLVWLPAWARSAPDLLVPRLVRVHEDAQPGWKQVLGRRDAWAIAIAKALTDPIWFFYLAWLPPFLDRRHGIGIAGIGLPLALVYLLSACGAVAGGAFSGGLMKRGWTASNARRAVMLMCAVAVLPVAGAADVTSSWSVVALGAIATAAHQAWSCNLFSLASDRFPRAVVGQVVGLAGTAAALVTIPFHAVTGHLVAGAGSYRVLFVVAAMAYLLAWVILQLLLTPGSAGSRSRGPNGFAHHDTPST
jgi:ACS family hexuronate transporter-like MFS transporter